MTFGKKRFDSSVVILAAGSSTRMGFSKPFLRWDDRTTFLEKLVDEYRGFCSGKIVVVLNTDNLDHYRLGHYSFLSGCIKVVNDHPEYERLYSVKIGVQAAGTDFPCFIQDGDNPFTNQCLLSMLYQHKQGNGYVVPQYKGVGGHPLLIGENILPVLSGISDYETTLKDVLKDFRRIKIECDDPSIAYNINTMDEYRRYFGLRMDKAISE